MWAAAMVRGRVLFAHVICQAESPQSEALCWISVSCCRVHQRGVIQPLGAPAGVYTAGASWVVSESTLRNVQPVPGAGV